MSYTKEQAREYHQRPEVKSRHRERSSTYYWKHHDAELQKMKERNQRPDIKLKRKEYLQLPEVKARKRELDRIRYYKNHEKMLSKNRLTRGKQRFYGGRYHWINTYWDRIWNTYRLRKSDWIRIWIEQNKGKCYICGVQMKLKSTNKKIGLHIDHSHKTGKVRHFLCSNCNRFLGFVSDDINRFERAVIYLRETDE